MNTNRPSKASTIGFYDEHADEFSAATLGLDLTHLYQPFLDLMPLGGCILDVGCGAGRDSKAFMDRGFPVTSMDASLKMLEATSCLTGRSAWQMRVQDMKHTSAFDGIWACASLLHVPRSEMADVMRRLETALRPGGVLFVSFKEGSADRIVGTRHFTDFTTSMLEAQVAAATHLAIHRTWVSDDVRPDRSQKWVNCLALKRR